MLEDELEDLRRRVDGLVRQPVESGDLGLPAPEVRHLVRDLIGVQEELAEQNQELRRAQDLAEQARLRYARLFEQAPTGYLTIDAAGLILRVNATFARMIDRPVERLVGRPFADYVSQEDRQRYLARFRAFFRHPGGKQFELGLLQPDGTSIKALLEGRVEIVEDEPEGERERLLLMVTDIAALASARDELRARERDLDVTLQSIGDAVLTTDDQGRITRLNPVAEELTGWRQNEVEGQALGTVFHIVNAKSRRPVADPVQKVLLSGRTVGLANHTILIARDGSERQISDSAAPIRDYDGRLLGVVLVFRDVTEEYELQEQLARSERQLRETLDSINEAFFALDAELCVTYFNPAAERLLHRSAQAVLGVPLFDAFPEARGSEFERRYRQALATREADAFEIHFDQPPFVDWFAVRVFPRGDGLAVFFQVTTERRLALEALQRSEERFRLLAEHMPVMIDAIDASGRISFWNRTCEQVTGYSRDEIRSHPDPLSLLYPDPGYRQELARRWLDQDQLFDGDEMVLTTKQGERRTILWSNLPHDQSLAHGAVWAIGLDITERKASEQALIASEARFRGLFAQAP
ncbi:MAG: PAS domain S-box protein, partial [Planctomycetota bacterium]